MSAEIGLSISFRWSRIRFRTQLIECIGNPEYIHLLIDRENKLLYVQACERDKDAFKVNFQNDPSDAAFYIRGKRLMEYLARVIGLRSEEAVRYVGAPFDSDTVLIHLKNYEVIARELE